jgi:hypothetical protein
MLPGLTAKASYQPVYDLVKQRKPSRLIALIKKMGILAKKTTDCGFQDG